MSYGLFWLWMSCILCDDVEDCTGPHCIFIVHLTTFLGLFLYVKLLHIYRDTGRFIMFSVITNIYNKKTKGPALMELFTVTGKLKSFFFDN